MSAVPGVTEPPPVSTAEALDDSAWFDAHRDRYYQRREVAGGGCWLVRRRGSRRRPAFLRVWAARLVSRELIDADPVLRGVWYRHAYPQLAARERNELISQARQRERGRHDR